MAGIADDFLPDLVCSPKGYMSLKGKLLLAIVLTFCSTFGYADPPARAGRLNYLSGTVSFAPAQAPDAWAVATLNRPLTTGDRLWADRDGYAEFHVGSTALRLAPRTSLDILSLDDNTLQLRLAEGDVNVRVREVADDAIEIDTPNGAVLLEEPGSYRVSTHDDATSVIVHSGRAHVLTQQSSFSVHANQQVALHGPDGATSAIGSANVDAFDRWSAELDRREDQIAATRYVSPHMTGYEDLDAHGTWRTIPEYGAIWVPRVSAGWAPYRYGHWVWIEPWGWTWIDDAPWGFAPFHYGRWVWLNGYWAWAPGPRIARPVYAPALVAFVGGSQWSVSIGVGPAVGWFPLGWREPYFPWYRTSPTYVRNVNITHVKNINIYNNVTRINYANRSVAQAVTVVPKEAFVSARPVARSAVKVPPGHGARAPLLKSTPAEPVQESIAAQRTGPRPPVATATREVFATRTPPARRTVPNLAAPSQDAGRTEGPRGAAPAAEPRVRVIERQRGDGETASRQKPKSVTSESALPASKPQPRTVPQTQRDTERGPRAADDTLPRGRPDVQRDERRTPTPAPEAKPRGAPERDPRAERAPTRPQPQEPPNVQRERRAPAPESRPRPKPEREPRADRGPAQPEPQQRPPTRREGAEAQRERRPPPAQSRPQRPEAPPRFQSQPVPQPSPRAEAPRPPQAQEAPRVPQPRMQAPRPESRGGSQPIPPPRAGGQQAREHRNNRD